MLRVCPEKAVLRVCPGKAVLRVCSGKAVLRVCPGKAVLRVCPGRAVLRVCSGKAVLRVCPVKSVIRVCPAGRDVLRVTTAQAVSMLYQHRDCPLQTTALALNCIPPWSKFILFYLRRWPVIVPYSPALCMQSKEWAVDVA